MEPSERKDLDLNPHPERVSEDYAETRIQEKIAKYEKERPQIGWRNVDDHLKEAGVPAAYRLHLITATANLGFIGERNLDKRLNHVEGGGRGGSPEGPRETRT